MANALQDAEHVVMNDRQKDYGHPYDDFNRAMGMLNSLGYRFLNPDGTYRHLSPTDQPIIMTCVKLSREVNHHKYDNIVDIHGYMKCLELVLQRAKEICAEAIRQEVENAAEKSDTLAIASTSTSTSACPAHPDDEAARRLAELSYFNLEDWRQLKLAHSKQNDHSLLLSLAREKNVPISVFWDALNRSSGTVKSS